MENTSSETPDWDWELIPTNSDKYNTSSTQSSPYSPSSGDDKGGGVIQSDYFFLQSEQNYTATSANDAAPTDGSSGEGGESDNTSWVDPSSSVVGGRRRMSWSHSSYSSPSSDSDSSGRNLLDFIQPHTDCIAGSECQNQSQGFTDRFTKSSEIGQISIVNDAEVNSGEGELGMDDQFSRSNVEDEEEKKSENDGNEKKMFVWWKVPVEVLKYCIMRVNPVWSLSMAAAALMGIVILRRRYLYKMKRKSQGIQLNVAVDNKKVSQFSRVARLNEAFSVVKRVPIIRPVLPAPGMASWQVMILR